MSMRLGKTAFSLFLMLLPAAAGAVDLELAAEGVTGYDDNIFRTSGDETGDAVFRFTPSVAFTDQDSKIGWKLRYRPTYEIFPQHTDANNLTHDLWGSLDYALDDKTEIGFTESYRRLEVLNYPIDDGVDDESNVVPDEDISREKIDINDGSFNLTHVFSPKWIGRTSAFYRLFYTDRKNADNSKTFAGSQSFQYALNAANDLGIGGSVTVQMFDGFEFQPANNTFFYNLFGTWERRFGESTTLSIQAGPALIHTDQDALDVTPAPAPTFPRVAVTTGQSGADLKSKYEFVSQVLDTTDPGNPQLLLDSDFIPAGSVLVPDAQTCGNNYNPLTDRCQPVYVILASDPAIPTIRDSTIPLTLLGSDSGTSDYKFTIFAEAKLTQRWTPTLFSSLEYSRRDATASAQGSGTVQDLVSFVTAWQPTERWDLSLRGTYLKRKSATDVSQALLGVVLPHANPYPELNGNLSYLEVTDAIDTERWSVYARAARRLTRRTTVTLRLSYADQQTRRSDRNPDSFHNFMALLGVRYDFDPIRF